MHSVLELLIKEGFIIFRDDNLVDAERAFFGARAIEWIRKNAPEPGFNLQAYLVALTYYKLGLADMKIEDNELLYRYRGAMIGDTNADFTETIFESNKGFHRPDEEPPVEDEKETGRTDNDTQPTESDE